METRNWKSEVMGVQSLSELKDLLNEMHETFEAEAEREGTTVPVLAGMTENDLCALPMFGGEEPADTQGIYSWDEKNLLVVGDGSPERYEIISR